MVSDLEKQDQVIYVWLVVEQTVMMMRLCGVKLDQSDIVSLPGSLSAEICLTIQKRSIPILVNTTMRTNLALARNLWFRFLFAPIQLSPVRLH